MKDLFKGHHPWLLVLVIAVDIFSALVIRHSILTKGESEFNANVFFCLIIIGGLALYAILVEFLSGQDMPLIGEKKGKEEMVKVPVSRPIAEETSVERPTEATVSRDDLEKIMRDVMTDLKREVAVPTGTTITKDDDGIVSVNINEMKNSASELVRTQEDAKYRFACEYTMKVLGSYIKQRDVPTLLFRLGLFQRASTPNWDPRSSEDIEAGVKIQRIEVSAPVEKWALLHYGWNMGRLFGKQNNFITHFLKSTFHYHLDGLSDNQLPKKLKQNPLQGVIKIEERFGNNFSIEEYRLSNDVQQSEVTEGTKASPISEDADPSPMTSTIETPHEETEPITPIQTENRPVRMPPLFEGEERPDDDDEWDNKDYDYSNDDEEEDEDDEPMTEEEFDNFIDRQMKKGKNSRCLDNELLAG
ncbi:MAG: hypothetical protein K1V84_07995 [Muribaculaceae bacterium]